MHLLYQNLTREQAETYGLVLLSANFPHEVKPSQGGWDLWVADAAVDDAQKVLQTYIDENKEIDAPVESPLKSYRKTWAGIWGGLFLLTMYVAVHTNPDMAAIHRTYASSASHILKGEWYRSATALLLHSDVVHLAGNLAGMAVFATAVCSVTGWGMGWLLILTTGISGNLINAYFYEYGHRAIGASTAVFGAVGLLCAYQFIKRIQSHGSRFQIWLPLSAGLALLAFLGASTHTDIMAHLFGLLAGMVLGIVYYWFFPKTLAWTWQTGALIFCGLVVVVAWLSPILK
jgi:membrane associated rhomboid family serine protease